jgi:uncharacterized protein (UPF0332 family)
VLQFSLPIAYSINFSSSVIYHSGLLQLLIKGFVCEGKRRKQGRKKCGIVTNKRWRMMRRHTKTKRERKENMRKMRMIAKEGTQNGRKIEYE